MDYTSNSHRSKSGTETVSGENKERVKRVVKGTAKFKKPGTSRKFIEAFVSEDFEKVKEYIIYDVALPTFKKFIDDMVSDGIHMMLYGSPNKKSSKQSRTSYDRFYDDKDEYKSDMKQSKRGTDYRDLTFETRGDAEVVLRELKERIRKYRTATIADLFDAADISTDDWTANKYGWLDLESAEIIRTYDGWYMIKMPKAVPID